MKIKPLHPLISCICITSNRPDMLLKAILSFDQQNYPNRELIISYPEDDVESELLLLQILKISQLEIVTITRPAKQSIGHARNNAVAKSNGKYICMWDDDDIYYYTRIADQHNIMRGDGRYFQSSLIPQIILFDATENKAYLSFPYHWSGSLLCKKEHLLQYPCTDSNQFECAPVIDYLSSRKLILQTMLSPSLYTYVYHGQNETEYFNFQYLIRKSQPLEEGYAQNIQQYLNQQLKINI